MDYNKLAVDIISNVGGKENINGLTHCVTRLRFTLADESKANKSALERLNGVMGVAQSGGQYQVIIGAEVEGVYNAIMNNIGATKQNKEEVKEKKTIKQILNNGLDVFISCFTPIIPVIAGSGMIKVLCYILTATHLLTETSSTYKIISMIGDGVYYFLPMFVAFTAAEKMKVDKFLAVALAAIMMHPTFLTLGDVGTYTGFLGIGLQVVNYSAQALPIILGVWLMKYVDKFSDKVSPKMVKIFLKPMITLLITVPIVLIAIGPLGSILGVYFAKFVDVMNKWGWIAVGLNAAIFPLLVLTGMHNALIPLMIQMFATQGFDSVLVPSGLIANIAESGAAGAVALKTKNKGLRAVAGSASFSALFGITEPALYGVNLRLKKPFIAMLIGSLVSGAIAGIFKLTAYTFVNPSLLSIPIFAGPASSFVLAIACVPMTYIITFIITYFMGFEDLTDESMNKIEAPIEGEIIELKDVQDVAFATEAMGKGFAIVPKKGEVVAPFDGQVAAVFPSKHAIGLKRVDGLELLIHIGLDTVNLNGEHFETLVSAGDNINKGDTLIKFDINAIKNAGYDVTTPVIVTNSIEYKDIILKDEVLYVER